MVSYNRADQGSRELLPFFVCDRAYEIGDSDAIMSLRAETKMSAFEKAVIVHADIDNSIEKVMTDENNELHIGRLCRRQHPSSSYAS